VDEGATATLPADWGLVSGRIHLEHESFGLSKTTSDELSVEYRHARTGESSRRDLRRDQDFFWRLPAGRYEIVEIFTLAVEIEPRFSFWVIPRAATYLGTLELRTGFEGGSVEVVDEWGTAEPVLAARLASGGGNLPILRGAFFHDPGDSVGARLVDAVLDERFVVPLYVDRGQPDTVLTASIARALGLVDADAMPRTAPTLRLPPQRTLVTLKSLRVGEAVATDFLVVVDDTEQLPFGILGRSFLRSVRIVEDEATGTVRIEP
jgi:hypothetical protein